MGKLHCAVRCWHCCVKVTPWWFYKTVFSLVIEEKGGVHLDLHLTSRPATEQCHYSVPFLIVLCKKTHRQWETFFKSKRKPRFSLANIPSHQKVRIKEASNLWAILCDNCHSCKISVSQMSRSLRFPFPGWELVLTVICYRTVDVIFTAYLFTALSYYTATTFSLNIKVFATCYNVATTLKCLSLRDKHFKCV